MSVIFYGDGLIDDDVLWGRPGFLIPVRGDPRELVLTDGPWDRRRRWVKTALNRVGGEVDRALAWCWPDQ